jgi:uncharacterized protein YjiS (DUF1127 family)
MSAHIANSELSFQLPSLSYIDAKWEEPELRQASRNARPARSRGFAQTLAAKVLAVRAWFRENAAAAELNAMSDRELQDIGMSRSDIDRVFDPALNQDLRYRGFRN